MFGGEITRCSGVLVILQQMAELVVSEHVVCGIICVQLREACLGVCVKRDNISISAIIDGAGSPPAKKAFVKCE